MEPGKRLYVFLALAALLMIGGTAAATSRSTPDNERFAVAGARTCDEQSEADDAEEADTTTDADNVELECEDQNEDDDTRVAAGTIDDGADLLSQATITLDQAIAAAQGAASGDLGEVDLEHVNGRLVFNVDIGDKDVQIDAADGTLVGVVSDD